MEVLNSDELWPYMTADYSVTILFKRISNMKNNFNNIKQIIIKKDKTILFQAIRL